jgi:hypothetical protein
MRPTFAVGLALAALGIPARPAHAQLADRVADVEDGTVRFAYETKPGVEICDQGVRTGDHHMNWRTRRGERASGCRSGIAEVEVSLRAGRVRDVELVSDPDDRRDAVDLGEVGPEEAARYLLSLPYEDATADAAEDAILPAMLADADDVWRDVLRLAEDRSLDEDIRKSATFWLGQEAAEAATEGLSGLALAEDEDQEVRNAAIFALSQRPDDEGLPALMELARTGEHAETRKTAMFWLAQSRDARVVAFFEEILLRRNR